MPEQLSDHINVTFVMKQTLRESEASLSGDLIVWPFYCRRDNIAGHHIDCYDFMIKLEEMTYNWKTEDLSKFIYFWSNILEENIVRKQENKPW